MKPRYVAAIALALLLILLPATASAGTIVADSGFRPVPNGFSFQNYGDEEGYANLDATDMQRLFGPAVCTAGKGAKCVLTPLARLWMEEENLSLAPTRPGLGTHPCPFCLGRQGRGSKYNEIRLSGSADSHADLLIIDSKGRKTGVVDGRIVNRIPGAKVTRRTSQARPSADGDLLIADSPVPIIRVPRNVKFRIGIDGRRLDLVDRETLTLVGPTYDATVENLVMGPGQVAEVGLSEDGQALTYRGSKRTKVPSLSFGDSTPRPRTYRVTIERFTVDGRMPTLSRTLTIAGGQRALIRYGALARPDGVPRIVVYSAGGKRIRTLPVLRERR